MTNNYAEKCQLGYDSGQGVERTLMRIVPGRSFAPKLLSLMYFQTSNHFEFEGNRPRSSRPFISQLTETLAMLGSSAVEYC